MRSIWNGSLSFGLVSIPVKMYSGSEERTLDLDMLDKKDHSRIRYKRVNEKTGKEVPWKQIVKGFKTSKGYVVLEPQDFEKANVRKSKTIDIEEFVKSDEVADVLFKKPYFLEPQKDAGKSYNLLWKALRKTGKLGVGTFVMREKENLALIGIYKKALVLHVIRFAVELRDPSELKLPGTKVGEKEVDMAVSLIDQYSETFDFDKYKDVYNDQLKKIIDAKDAGETVDSEEFEAEATPARDLMAQLKASLERKTKKMAS